MRRTTGFKHEPHEVGDVQISIKEQLTDYSADTGAYVKGRDFCLSILSRLCYNYFSIGRMPAIEENRRFFEISTANCEAFSM